MFEDPVFPPVVFGYELRLTCGACPEQYDVCFGAEIAGYLRLRHGRFTASAPGVSGDRVYEAVTEGDGMFLDHERVEYLEAAVLAIDMWRREKGLACPSSGHAAMEMEAAIGAAASALGGLSGRGSIRVAMAVLARRLGLGDRME